MNCFKGLSVQTDTVSSEAQELRNECRLFTRYLLGETPNDYVLDRYVSLQTAVVEQAPASTATDDVLLSTARSSVFGVRIADAYARIFLPHCLLRRKLVLTFAILENSGGFHARFTSGVSSSYAVALIRVAASVMGFGIALVASLFIIVPRALLAGRQNGHNNS